MRGQYAVCTMFTMCIHAQHVQSVWIVCEFVCQFVPYFSACLQVQDSFKGSFNTQQVVQAKNKQTVACRWPMIVRNGLEARKNACFDVRLNEAQWRIQAGAQGARAPQLAKIIVLLECNFQLVKNN